MERQEWKPEDATVQGLGDLQEVTPHRMEHSRTRLEELEMYHSKAQTHLWVVLVSYAANDSMLDSIDSQTPERDGPAILDADSMLGMPAIGCYICEMPYDARARRRKCPGGPR